MNPTPHDASPSTDNPAPNPSTQPDPVDRRKRRLRIARNIAIGVLGTLFAIWLILFITKGRFLKSPVEAIASSMTEREVEVKGDFQLYFAPFRIKFLAEGLTVSNPEWATRPYLFTARRVDTRDLERDDFFLQPYLQPLKRQRGGGRIFDVEIGAAG